MHNFKIAFSLGFHTHAFNKIVKAHTKLCKPFCKSIRWSVKFKIEIKFYLVCNASF